jgi:hypothetical protein
MKLRGMKVGDYQPVAQGDWGPSDTALGYTYELGMINTWFSDLMANFSGFNTIGHVAAQEQETNNLTNTEAISNLFVRLAILASGEIVTGVNESTMSAALSNIIRPTVDSTKPDYNENGNRIIYIVFNYNPATRGADGVGFIYFWWNLKITDYKNKSKNGGDSHTTTVTMNAQSAVYSDINVLLTQYKWVMARHPVIARMLRGIPPVSGFKIFDTLPPLGEDTWGSALLLESKGDKLTALVFYAADLICLGSLDNKASAASSNYSIATTSGMFYLFLILFLVLHFTCYS